MTMDEFDDPRSHARRSDPDTSHEAAAAVSITAQMFIVLQAYCSGRALLDHDAYRLVGFPPHLARQRCSDLRLRGFIERTGERGRTPSGRAGYLCRITEKGLAFAQRRKSQGAAGDAPH